MTKFNSSPSMALPLRMWRSEQKEINVLPTTSIAAAANGSSGFTLSEDDLDRTTGTVDRMFGTEKKKRTIKKRKRGLRFCERSKAKKTSFCSTLPTGWVVEKCVRTHGVHAGMVDKYYIDPDTGVKFRSRTAVERYLLELEEEKVPLKMLGFHKDKISQQRKMAAVEGNRGVGSRNFSLESSDDSIIKECACSSGHSAKKADKMLGIVKKERSIKKRKRRRRFHGRVKPKKTSFSSTLPTGWIVEEFVRTHGAHIGRVDRFYIDPDTGVKFRSRPAVERYLLELEEEKVPLKMLGFHKKKKTSHQRKMASLERNRGVRSRTFSLELSDSNDSIIEKCARSAGNTARKADKMLGFQKNKISHQREMAIVEGNSEARTTSFKLPDDWITEKCVRSSGKSAGTVDKYYIEPGTMRRYRSRADVQRRLAELDESSPSFNGSKSDKFIRMSGVGKKGILVYKRRLATVSGTTTTITPSSSKLPEGWVVEEHPRISGRFAGVVDKYYIEPGTMRKFRSLISVKRHLAKKDCSSLTLQQSDHDDLHLAEGDCSLLTLQQSNQDDRHLAEGDCSLLTLQQSDQDDRHLAEGDCSLLTLQQSDQDDRHLAEGDCSLLTLQQSDQDDRHLAEGDFSLLTLQQSDQDDRHLAEGDCSLLTLQQSNQDNLLVQSQDLLPSREADPKEKTPSLDTPKSPMKIKWVFSGTGGDTWNPYIDESMVADSVKQRWNDSFISSFDLL